MELLSYPFFLRALAAAALISIACGIVGTYIVSRRIVFMAGGISHASFGGIGIGYYLGFDPIAGAGVFAVLAALLTERLSEKSKMRIDSAIGLLWSLGMALGIIFIFLTPGYAPDLTVYLFGSILTISAADLWAVGAVTLTTALSFALLFRKILYIAFDAEYARTQGIPVRVVSYYVMALTALTIVISIRAVGIILIISMLTIPQVTALLLTGDFKKMLFLSIGFALLASVSGLVFSAVLEIPSGAAIIFTSAVIYALTAFMRNIILGFSRRRKS